MMSNCFPISYGVCMDFISGNPAPGFAAIGTNVLAQNCG